MSYPSYSIVLVQPQGARNVGSVCRAMANFGFTDLRLVNPVADYRSDEARHMAVHAAELLDRALVYPSLAEALADCHYVFGTTRRFGKYRRDVVSIDAIGSKVAALAPAARIALLFGREDKGLRTAELALCQGFLTVPTDDRLPSMNLAQAVAVTLYELHKALGGALPEPHHKMGRDAPAEGMQLEMMMDHMRQTLLQLGYLNPQNPDHVLFTYRRIFGRAVLSQRDVRILEGLWSKIDWLLAKKE